MSALPHAVEANPKDLVLLLVMPKDYEQHAPLIVEIIFSDPDGANASPAVLPFL